ncbi:hypothetical protein T484DRAFT_3628329 [Baffinella frigidus]|nr:hypothetical protein T484DRAFT_3628329 [Cryptophyta sp. CCMP2293]
MGVVFLCFLHWQPDELRRLEPLEALFWLVIYVLTAPARPAFAAAWGVLAWAGAWAGAWAVCAWTVALGGVKVAATAVQLVDERVLYRYWTPDSTVVCNRYALFWWVFNIVVVNCILFYIWSVAVRNFLTDFRFSRTEIAGAYCCMWYATHVVWHLHRLENSRRFLGDYTGGACSYAHHDLSQTVVTTELAAALLSSREMWHAIKTEDRAHHPGRPTNEREALAPP